MVNWKVPLEQKKYLNFLLEKGDVNKGLEFIRFLTESITRKNEYTSLILSSSDLDNFCQKFGAIALKKQFDFKASKISKKGKKVTYLYIVSQILKSGGHTRLVENFIRADRNGRHIILSTELVGNSDFSYLASALKNIMSFEFESAPFGDYENILFWLQRRIIEIKADKLFLFNHHQDSVIISSIQPSMNLNAYYCHHADHNLALGVYLKEVKHIDFHPMGFFSCKDVLGIKNHYLPLTMYEKGRKKNNINKNKFITCTVGNTKKVEDESYSISYIDMIPKILLATGGSHIHIGDLTNKSLKRIHRSLLSNNINPSNFIYKPYISNIWKAFHDFNVDIHIASFPLGAALTFIEALGAGIPSAVYINKFSNLLSLQDLTCKGTFLWDDPKKLLEFLSRVDISELQLMGELSREFFEKNHNDSFLALFIKMGKFKTAPNKINKSTYTVNKVPNKYSFGLIFLIKTFIRKIYFYIRNLIRVIFVKNYFYEKK